MKPLLQFVAVLVVAVLAIPPAFADGLCLLTQNESTAMECCSGIEHISAPATSMAVSVAQSCDEGCCSVAPPSPVAPTVPDKFKTDSPTISAPQALADFPVYSARNLTSVDLGATGLTHDLPVLLQTFRI